MKYLGHLAASVNLVVNLLTYLRTNLKRVAKLLIWKWRAEKRSSIIRSLDVSLSAQIGERVIIENGVFLDSTSVIGNYTYINQYSSIENADVGRFCSIARGVMIGPAEHDLSKISTHPFWYQSFYGFDVQPPEKPNCTQTKTVISDDVWIGCNAIIKRGVVIQTGAVIGAGAVVTKDVGPYEIWGGVPARKIKQRFNGEVIEKMLQLNWCNLNVEQIESNILPYINNIQYLIRDTNS